MQVQRNTLHFEETAESRRNHGDEDFHELNVSLVFSALLKCARCGEHVSCCGIGGYESEERQNEEGDVFVDYTPIFFPKYSAPMRIFHPANGTPPQVKVSIDKSFLLFFCDLGAAANHVRQSVEEILSHAGVAATKPNGGFIRLDDRIKSLEKKDPDKPTA